MQSEKRSPRLQVANESSQWKITQSHHPLEKNIENSETEKVASRVRMRSPRFQKTLKVLVGSRAQRKEIALDE